ncbi:ribonuclease R family protein [Sulfurimonas sp. HSL-1716]|uniref:ribonuclease R family protein n=1 Tax=Hydrocurvibacter sulfurireducens TaxID=3131937 RepID=UPI0031F9913E
MKSLLIRLTLGLYDQDVDQQERPFVEEWLAKNYLIKEGSLYRFHSKYRAGEITLAQNGTAYLNSIGLNVKDLFIDEGDLGDAKNGDLVVAKRLLAKRGTPSAKVVEVVGRAQTYSVAFVSYKEKRKSLLDIRTLHPAGVVMDEKELSSYDIGTVFKVDNLTSTIMEVLGNLDDPLVDEKIVLAQYNKHDKFSDEVIKLAKSFEEVDASFYPERKDLRHLPFCTIDPVTAKDFDDAICWDDKKHILYVAIADVSEYVKPFGPIDAEAMYRGFSIYLPHRSIPMLPRQLSETLCSLQPDVDRLAYAFEIHLDKDTLEVVHSDVYETIIHSKRRFNYEEIDEYFEGRLKPKNDAEKEVLDYINPLRRITDRLREKRLKVGFDFRSDEIEMKLDQAGEIISTTVSEETPSHSLIEDCMLLANKAAASMYDRGVFRVHEPPSQTKIQSLYNELAGIGIFVEPQENMKETIGFIQKKAREMGIESDVDTLIIQAQRRARYSPDNHGHFGLGFEKYTHFTSPIRRYSDLIVHRLIKAIKANDTEEGSYVLRNIESLTIAVSEKERESADVEFRFMDRKYARWAQKHIGKKFKARIEATDPHLIAKLNDEITGATLHVRSQIPVMLFDDVEVIIEEVDIATTKISTTVVQKIAK